MTIDDRATRAATAVREQTERTQVPEAKDVLARARRRDIARRVGVLVTVVAVAVAGVIVADRGSEHRGVQVGDRDAGSWQAFLKRDAGLGAASDFSTIASNGRRVVVAGGALRQPTDHATEGAIWWSDDGRRWHESTHPGGTTHISAVALDGNVGLAIGTDDVHGMSTVAWRSQDAGRTWRLLRTRNLFVDPAPEMGRPFVAGLARHGDRWVAWGGGSSGYEGIWTSLDGVRWRQVVGGRTSGSVDVTELGDGGLLGYGVAEIRGAHEAGWRSRDGRAWRGPEPIELPPDSYLSSVGRDASLGISWNITRHDGPTRLLRSTDHGRTWTEDAAFAAAYPDAWLWSVTRAGGRWFVAGATLGDGQTTAAWVSSDGRHWQQLPPDVAESPEPLALVASVGDRVVLLGTAPEAGHYYTFTPDPH